MKVLVVGGGGREHAIIWKLSQSYRELELYCAPGNAGISELAVCVDIKATDIPGLIEFAKNKKIDFTIIGPDDPLMLGIVDGFENAGLPVFGPRKNAAIIEYSKAFSKNFMKKYGIPTAGYEVFDDYDKAVGFIKEHSYPLVIKADGLALGKGVVICGDYEQAQDALKEMMVDKKYGESGTEVVVEEFVTGPEVSILSFCDGNTVVPMVSAQDHKRALDGDEGLNTGGMGTFSPSRYYTGEIAEKCMETIFKPTVEALKKEGLHFQGIIYFGLMLTERGPVVIEYNARFGDPEAQVILPRLKTDLLDVFMACERGTLHNIAVEWEDNAAACVVMASGGYPEKYMTGYEISGLETVEAVVFHAGTKKSMDGKVLTNGGRVLGITGVAETLEEAIGKAYAGVKQIDFRDVHYRKDIGVK